MIQTSADLPGAAIETPPFPVVIGQEQARKVLLKALSNDKLSHAYLFAGPDGTGRWALATELARVLNCSEDRDASVHSECNCRSCRNIRSLQHPNLTFLFPLPTSSDTKKAEEAIYKALEEYRTSKAKDPYNALQFQGSGWIRIDQIRELRNQMSLTPDRKGVRVAIIQPANRMNPQAANALLKLLEEPPDKCCIILIANSVKSLLPTIVSRSHIIRFTPLASSVIGSALHQRYGVSEEIADLNARMAKGSFALARGLIDENLQDQLKECLDFLRFAVVGKAVNISAIVDEWSRLKSKQEISEKLDYVGVWIRDALINKSFVNDETNHYMSTSGQKETINRMAELYSAEQLSSAWKEIEEAKLDIDSNAMISLVLTALALKIHRIFK